MNIGFARVQDVSGQERTVVVDVTGGRVVDISDLAPAGLLGLIRAGHFNDPGWIEVCKRTAADRPACEWTWAEFCAARPPDRRGVLLPFVPPEVWGVGVSYQRAARLHEDDLASRQQSTGIYDYVFRSARPEVFFKALAHHCVAHGQAIGLRGDSIETMVEAELACVLDARGAIVGYTIANDVTAWDIERESPLFLSYCKIFTGCCALGPLVVPACLVSDPKRLAVTCEIVRGGQLLYRAEGTTADMRRSIEEMVAHMHAFREIGDGTVLCTGTAVGIPNGLSIQDGDEVTIEIERMGRLSNCARRLQARSEARG